MNKLLTVSVVLATLMTFALGSEAKVYLDINAPGVRKVPVAVAPLKLAGSASGDGYRNVDKIIRHDLAMTETFELLDPKGFLEDSQRAPLTPTPDGFRDWGAIGAELLVKGRYIPAKDKATVELFAFDVFKGKFLFGKRYKVDLGQERQAAHLFANTILEKMTGTPGPFGTRLAYVVKKGLAKEIKISSIDGTGQRWVTGNGSLNLSPGWSRDGKKLYFTSYLWNDPDLYRIDLKTGKWAGVSRKPGVDLPGEESPDRENLLLVRSDGGDSNIFRRSLRGGKFVKLTQDRGIDVGPVWSPDGEKIAFVSDRKGNPHLFVMNGDGGSPKRITFSGKHNGDPSWSPDGKLIAFSGMDAKGTFQIFVVDPEGRNQRQLTFGPWDTLEPSWSPDGRFLAVTSRKSGKDGVYVMRLGGSKMFRVSRAGEEASQPAWEF